MDAISCVGVAPQSALLTSRSFADAAIARALHFSLSDAPEPSPPAAAADAATAAALMHGFGGHHPPVGSASAAPSPSPSPSPSSSSARCRALGPAGRYAGKRRRPRPSKRAPTTYISTDAATFRAMVQRVTGADEDELLQLQQGGGADGGLGLGLLLPQLGVEQFFRAAGPAAHAAAAAYTAAAPPPAAAEQQQPLFPTLDSWNVMYGKKNEVV